MPAVRAHCFVEGRVQGVFFRDSTWQRAREVGVSGWVRNLPDGRVEVVAEGQRENVEALVAWLRGGPKYARVDELGTTWESASGEFADFTVRG
jgi:acylphosphatase